MKALLLPLLLGAAGVSAQDQPPGHYHVAIDDAAGVARVTATLVMKSNVLAMYNVVRVPGLPDGQASLIADLQVRDAAGAAVAHRDLGGGDFEIDSAGAIELSYTVLLEHDQHTWPFGVEEVAYRTPEGLMSTGYALFLADATDQGAGPYEVSFDLPEGWHAHTPWERIGDEPRFRVATRRDLLVNALFLGRAHTETIDAGGLELTLVLGAPYVASRHLFVDLLRAQADSYSELFGAPPLTDRFLVIVNRSALSDGGAFAGSFSQVIEGDASEANRVVWGVAMAHELLHFWNGLALVPADDREEWFKEGATDYLTTATMARNGLLDRGLVHKRIELLPARVIFARYGQGLSMSVRTAGADKQANRQLIYGGGAVAALALDVELRRRSQDRVGLPDLMRTLYAAHVPARTGYTLDDIARTAGKLTGTDFTDFLAGVVESNSVYDLRPALRELGLRLDQFFDEAYVSSDPRATPAQRGRCAAIFGPASC